jgi:pyruvate-ferredoxin/flavodoxin oxidoreductase
LFEDNAEFGLGMHIGNEKIRENLASIVKEALTCEKCSDELKAVLQEWLDVRHLAAKSAEMGGVRLDVPDFRA